MREGCAREDSTSSSSEDSGEGFWEERCSRYMFCRGGIQVLFFLLKRKGNFFFGNIRVFFVNTRVLADGAFEEKPGNPGRDFCHEVRKRNTRILRLSAVSLSKFAVVRQTVTQSLFRGHTQYAGVYFQRAAGPP